MCVGTLVAKAEAASGNYSIYVLYRHFLLTHGIPKKCTAVHSRLMLNPIQKFRVKILPRDQDQSQFTTDAPSSVITYENVRNILAE